MLLSSKILQRQVLYSPLLSLLICYGSMECQLHAALNPFAPQDLV